MAGKFDNVPQATREAISIALFVGAISATAAALLHQPLFLLGGLVLFGIAYVVRIHPMLKKAYLEQEELQRTYSADESYEPILERFHETGDEDLLIAEYQTWKQGPYDNEVRLRFLQEAILSLIDEGKIYRVEELMGEVEILATAQGLTERFQTFRAECDHRIAEIAQQRLAQPDEHQDVDPAL